MAGKGKTERTLDDVFALLEKQVSTLNEVNKNVKFCKDKLEGHDKRIKALESKSTANTREISKVAEANHALHSEVNQLKGSLEQLKQNQLKNYIDILGVPMSAGENLEEIVLEIATKSGIQIDSKDIKNCYRQSRPSNRDGTGIAFHPSIAVEFSNDDVKTSLLQGLKARSSPLTTSDLGLGLDETSNIYVNEKLTPHLKRVFLEARRAKKDNHIKYVWTKQGKILGRVEDGAPTLVFHNTEDIEAAIGKATEVEATHEDPSPEKSTATGAKRKLDKGSKSPQSKRGNSGVSRVTRQSKQAE